ncbi:MAG: transglutaminase domain-containing protein [Chloroflexota bacterium]
MSNELENEAQHQRWWDLPSALLLLAAMLTASSRLVATRWTIELALTETLAFFGCIAGLALGQSRFSPRLARFFAFAYGLFAIPWQLGILLKHDLLWTERLTVLYNRLDLVYYQIFYKEPVTDSILFVIFMCILFWALATHAGYTLVRSGNAWETLLPTGISMFVIHSFDPLVTRRAWYLAVYLFFGLVLVARMVYLHHHDRWQSSRTALPPHTGLEFIRFTIIATAIVVLLAWTIPGVANALPAAQKAWQPVQRTWNSAKQRFENVFASLRSSVALVSEIYGDSAVLGRGNPLSSSQVFNVRVPNGVPSTARLYWRARTYDVYNDGQWFSTITRAHTFNPQVDELSFPEEYGRWLGTFSFISAAPIGTMFTPPQPIWVDQPSVVEYIENPDSTVDISTFRATPSLEPGQVYKVQASLSNATVAQLKDSGTEYPEWITERYLQLPETITPRTYQLADDITADLTNPYDKAQAITEYLRKNITYVETLDRDLPRNQEIIDWFLFDYRKGFCNYYATAEIVLLRAAGIPARWAVGYAQGEELEQENLPLGSAAETTTYMIRQQDAHAWPEVYFQGIGWVEFEPTASLPEIVRLTGDSTANLRPSSPSDLEEQLRREMEDEMALLREDRNLSPLTDAQQNRSTVVYWLLPLATVCISALVYWMWRSGIFFVAWQDGLLTLSWRGKRHEIVIDPAPIVLERNLLRLGIKPPPFVHLWAQRAALPPLPRAYLEINTALTRLDSIPPATATPTERAASLGQILPPAQESAHKLVREYQKEIFGRQDGNLSIALVASTTIKRLSLREWRRKLLSRLQRPIQLTRQSK